MNKFLTLLLTLLFSTLILADDKKPFMVFLREGTILTKIKNNKTFKLTEGVRALVLADDPIKKTFFIVYNNKGKPLYKVHSNYIHDVLQDIEMLPNVDAAKVFPPISDFKKEDKKYIFETQTVLHYENIQMKELNSVYSSEINMAFAPRFELRNFYTNHLPIKVGIAMNYQTIYWKNEAEDFKLSNVSLGPILKYDFSSNSNYSFSAVTSGEISLDCRTTSITSNDSFSATAFSFGFENEWDTEYGKISLGINYRKQQMTLTKSSNAALELSNNLITLNSFGMMMGYRFDWDL